MPGRSCSAAHAPTNVSTPPVGWCRAPGLLPRDQWQVLIPDHHPGFITWERFEQIQDQLRANWRPPRGHGGGAVREGTALLQGLIRCGRCGRMMQTAYSGAKGNCPRYACARAAQLYGNPRHCQSLGGRRLEQRVLDEVFAVLEPAALAATAKALNDADALHRQRLGVFELAVERARFEADRARRQFDAVEPENRLVARTLERAWETALSAQRQAEADLVAQRARRPTRLTADEIAWLTRAGADVRAVFNAADDHMAGTQAAAARRHRRGRRHRARRGPPSRRAHHLGRRRHHRVRAHLEQDRRSLPSHRRRHRRPRASPRRALRRHDDRHDPVPAAPHAPAPGCRSPAAGSAACATPTTSRCSNPTAVTPSDDDGVVVTIYQAEKLLGVDKSTIYRWLHTGFITGEQLTAGGPWHLRITDELRRRVVPDVPDGWLPLDQAARALGVARQTVLHKVQRGELAAVHVNRGKRKGLRIQVEPASPGLFATTE